MYKKTDKIGVIGEVEITLIKRGFKTENFSEVPVIEEEVEVMAVEKSITRTDFFQSQQYGFNQSRLFIVNRNDFNNHNLIRVGKDYYKINRFFYLGEYIELHGELSEPNSQDFE